MPGCERMEEGAGVATLAARAVLAAQATLAVQAVRRALAGPGDYIDAVRGCSRSRRDSQATQRRAVGASFSRASGISVPQSAHSP